jgi:hypothetical protein
MFCSLRFGVIRDCTSSFENDFVDIETFSDTIPEARDGPVDSFVVASSDGGTSKTVVASEEASPKFTKDLERTVSRSGGLLQDPSLIKTLLPLSLFITKASVRLIEVNC